MTFDDFVTYFTEISVCHLLNTSLFTFSRRWIGISYYGQWTTGTRGSAADRAGGCANHLTSFLRNPQYCFEVASDDEEIIVQLSQPDVRERRRKGAENMVLGLHILKVEENREYRIHTTGYETAGRSDYIKTRSVILRQPINRGRYILLPTTFTPGQTGEYLLRFFATCHVYLREIKEDAPKPSIWCCVPPPSAVTSITVRKISGLEDGTTDAYCIVKCEGKSIRSATVANSSEATWDFKVLFYRKTKKPITVEVWNRNVVIDSFLGQVQLDASTIGSRMLVKMDLKGRGRQSDEIMPGRLTLEYQTEDDLLKI